MASKKRYTFEKRLNNVKKFGGAGASISCAVFEKEGHYCRHFEKQIIRFERELSFLERIIPK